MFSLSWLASAQFSSVLSGANQAEPVQTARGWQRLHLSRSLGPGVGRHSGGAGDMIRQNRPDYVHVSPEPPRPY